MELEARAGFCWQARTAKTAGREVLRNNRRTIGRENGCQHRTMRISQGTVVNSYEVLDVIGAGGMGEVYRARDVRLGRDVALKLLPRDFATAPQRMARFEGEAKVLASRTAPNIATIDGIDDAQGRPAIAMELVNG